MDDGANLTIVSEEVADKLGVKGTHFPFSVIGINGTKVEHQTQLLPLSVTCKSSKIKKNLVARTLPNPTGNLHMVDWNLHKKQWPHLNKLEFPEVPEGNPKVQMIIGNDQSYLHRAIKEVYGTRPGDPVARLTPLGWTVTGRIHPEAPALVSNKCRNKERESNCRKNQG